MIDRFAPPQPTPPRQRSVIFRVLRGVWRTVNLTRRFVFNVVFVLLML